MLSPFNVGATTGNYPILAKSFVRSLKAENKSPHTIDAYLQAIRSFGVE